MKKILIITLICVGVMVANRALAAENYATLSPLPCISGSSSTICGTGGNGSLMDNVDINAYVQKMFNLFIALAAVASVFMLVMGGFEYMTTDAFSGKEEAKKRLWNAVKGLILVLCSFLILRTINPKLVEVPVNLVAPLGVKIDPSTGTFISNLENSFNALAADVRYQSELQTFKAGIDAAKGDVLRLQSELDSINSQLASGYDGIDPTFDPTALEARKALVESALKDANSTIAYNAAQGSLAAALRQCELSTLPSSKESSACSNANSLAEMVQNVKYQLQPDQYTALAKQEVYTKTAMAINQVMALYNKDTPPGVLSSLATGVLATGVPLSGLLIYKLRSDSYEARVDAYKKDMQTIIDNYSQSPRSDPNLLMQLKSKVSSLPTH